jgi:hypothetical protein
MRGMAGQLAWGGQSIPLFMLLLVTRCPSAVQGAPPVSALRHVIQCLTERQADSCLGAETLPWL